MQLNITTDYAIRTIIYLGSQKEIVTSVQIAEGMKIPHSYLAKVLRKLKNRGMIAATAGSKGGYYLTKDLKEITIGEILETMENTMKINRCLEQDEYCSRYATDYCQVRSYFAGIQTILEKKVMSVTMEEVLKYGADCLTMNSQKTEKTSQGEVADNEID